MQANFRSHFRFAMLGFAVAAFFVAYQLLTSTLPDSPRDTPVMIAFVVLCPPSLLSVLVREVEIGTHAFYFVWAVIAILNAAFYGTISALIRRRKRKRSA